MASAVVSASLRAKKVALRDPTASTKRVKSAKDRFRRALHRYTLKFDTLLSVAQQLQGKKRPISPQLYQVCTNFYFLSLLASCIATRFLLTDLL